MDTTLIHRLMSIPVDNWWVVRAESGLLWDTLFVARSVVAQGTNIPRFDIGLEYEARQRAMQGLDEYDKREVNDFIDNLDDAGVIVPDAGSQRIGVGYVRGPVFVGHEAHWQQRPCAWHAHWLDAPREVAMYLRGLGPRGTLFSVPKACVSSLQSKLCSMT